MLGKHLDHRVGDGHDTLRVVLGQSDIDRTALDTLDLTPDMHKPAQEVNVAELQRAASPRQRPAKAQRATNTRNRGSAASRMRRTTSGEGIAIAASRCAGEEA